MRILQIPTVERKYHFQVSPSSYRKIRRIIGDIIITHKLQAKDKLPPFKNKTYFIKTTDSAQ